jgi:hypothetical protein
MWDLSGVYQIHKQTGLDFANMRVKMKGRRGQYSFGGYVRRLRNAQEQVNKYKKVFRGE